ncbi:hypothetical protein CR513_48831, partial [Mucuna pruriens]
MCCFVHYRDRVHCHYKSRQGVSLNEYLLFYDSQRAIHLGKNSTFHSRSKHIDVRYHWIHDAFNAKLLELAKFHIDDNGIDMMTKVLLREKFEACCEITRLTSHVKIVISHSLTIGSGWNFDSRFNTQNLDMEIDFFGLDDS